MLVGGGEAAFAETVAELIQPDPTKLPEEIVKEYAAEGNTLTPDKLKEVVQHRINVVAGIAKVITTGAAVLLQKDPDIALDTATSALENNYNPHAVYIALMRGASIASSVYGAMQIYDTYLNEGAEAALKQAGYEAAVGKIGKVVCDKVFTIAGNTYLSAELAWAAYVAQSPAIAKVAKEIVDATNTGKRFAKSAYKKCGEFASDYIGSPLGRAYSNVKDFGMDLSAGANKQWRKMLGKAPKVTPKPAEHLFSVEALDLAGGGNKFSAPLKSRYLDANEGLRVVRDKHGRVKGVTHTQIHHIIHEKLNMHRLWKLSGLDPQSSLNKMILPTKMGKTMTTTNRSVHQGRHTNASRQELEKRMTEIVEEGKALNWTQEQFKDHFSTFIQTQRKGLKDGKIGLYKVELKDEL